jgi:hypothetical protein
LVEEGFIMGGTSKTPRWANGNIDWGEVYAQYVRPIIDSQIAPNTGRGLMYILESKQIVVKSDYNQLITHLRDWRKDGRIRWHQIADGSGRGIINDFNDYQSPEDFIGNRIKALKYGGDVYNRYLNGPWKWYGQNHYVEYWLEKHAIAGTVAALVNDRYVKVAFNRGNPGWGFMHDNCERLKNELYTEDENGERILRKIHINYLGDDDEKGRHMDLEIRAQLEFFEISDLVDFKRIALTEQQVKSYDLPANFESGKGYEVDALNAFKPKEFAKLIRGHSDRWFDKDIHERMLERFTPQSIDDQIRERISFLDEDEDETD